MGPGPVYYASLTDNPIKKSCPNASTGSNILSKEDERLNIYKITTDLRGCYKPELMENTFWLDPGTWSSINGSDSF